jgi:hypothetical protein
MGVEAWRGTCLLVGKDEQDGIAQLVLGQHAGKLLAGLAHTLAIVRVDHEDQTWRWNEPGVLCTRERKRPLRSKKKTQTNGMKCRQPATKLLRETVN